SLADRLLGLVGAVWNVYGPTETTIWSLVERVERGSGPVPIGRPIVNTEVYILDEQMEPRPIGVPGELYLGGEGLANGYRARPELTAERFVPHPFAPGPSRLYRTGDRAAWRLDAAVEFLGRADQQVKLRGVRIELGEVAAALTRHPAVREAVAIVRDNIP